MNAKSEYDAYGEHLALVLAARAVQSPACDKLRELGAKVARASEPAPSPSGAYMGYFSSIISVGDETIELLVKVFPPTQRDNSDVVIVITSGYRTFRQTFEVVNADGVIKVRVGEDTVMRQIDSFINQVVDDIVKRHVAKNNLYRSL